MILAFVPLLSCSTPHNKMNIYVFHSHYYFLCWVYMKGKKKTIFIVESSSFFSINWSLIFYLLNLMQNKYEYNGTMHILKCKLSKNWCVHLVIQVIISNPLYSSLLTWLGSIIFTPIWRVQHLIGPSKSTNLRILLIERPHPVSLLH